ncbi:hypothetical protein [Reyranella sp.]|uniref:hypothetical protein n=1 Tax=Reyranella sp. TaxID=1929291 RepID=UPI003BAA0018
MLGALIALAAILAADAVAQTQGLTFERAAYLTCREAHALPRNQRVALAEFLADHVARHRGVTIPDGEQGAQLASLVRGGCTISPDAYLFVVIDRAVAAESGRLPNR